MYVKISDRKNPANILAQKKLIKSSEKLLCEYICCLFPSEIST